MKKAKCLKKLNRRVKDFQDTGLATKKGFIKPGSLKK